MIGVSLHPGVVLPALADVDSAQIARAFGGAEQVLPCLYAAGVRSIELRAKRYLTPEEMLAFFRRVREAGMHVTAHSALRSVSSAVSAVLSPFHLVREAGLQDQITVTLHPLPDPEDTVRALAALADAAPNFTFALENNRRLPDGSIGDPCPLVLDIVMRVNRKNVGICWDFGHHWYNVLTLKSGDRTALPPAGFIARTVHTHIHGTNGLTTHFPASNESLPLNEWCAALAFAHVYNLELEPARYDESIDVKDAYLSSIRQLAAAIPPGD